MRSIYGEPMSPTNTEFSYEERVRLRRVLDALDQKEAGGGMKEFDLNKPNVPAYQFREYPFLMYNHETGATKAAVNVEQRRQMLEAGWSEDPVPPEPPNIELTPEEQAEAQAIDKQLTKKRRS